MEKTDYLQKTIDQIKVIILDAIYRDCNTYSLTNEVLDHHIDGYLKFYKVVDKNGHLIEKSNSNLKALIRNYIYSQLEIEQEEGDEIIGDYNHNYDWYKNLKLDNKRCGYWFQYKNYLKNTKELSPKVINTIDIDTNKIMSYIGDPNQDNPFSIRGLVMGDVQSGKTSNYLGIITKAADAGYKYIFILTGTIESLRKQTQIRIEEGFIGYDSIARKKVGVGLKRTEIPYSFTNRNSDFNKNNSQNTFASASNDKPMIFVVKKQIAVLTTIYDTIHKINLNNKKDQIDESCLIIDDEADNASINTSANKEDPTAINNSIRKILGLFTKTSYIGFTATPFANVFIGYDTDDEMLRSDLFPKDFIYVLNTPTNYFGAQKYFSEKNNNIRIIDDLSEQLFPMKHPKTFSPTNSNMFPSFFEAINSFLIVNTIRDIREEKKNTHRSMLINMTRFVDVQNKILNIVNDYLNQIKIDLKQTLKSDDALKNKNIFNLKQTFENQFGHVKKKISWEQVKDQMFNSIENIKTFVINSRAKSSKLNYEDFEETGLRAIAIGGLSLSRGLTLEGLCVSYFYRNTIVFDVLMQMGRWFGYRGCYSDLCKIYITEESRLHFNEINQSMIELKKDFKRMHQEKKKPIDFGIRIRNNSIVLKITAANKMRDTSSVIKRVSCFGHIFETAYLYSDDQINKNNLAAVKNIIHELSVKQLDNNIKPPYFRNVSVSKIIKLLNETKFYSDLGNYDACQIVDFMNKNTKDINSFDLLLINGDGKETRFDCSDGVITFKPVIRAFDYDNNLIVLNKRRLMGKDDTRFGLDNTILEQIKKQDKIKTEDYLIASRSPLLIIYLIESKEPDFMCNSHDDNYRVGLAVGFPNINNETTNNVIYYVVNNSQNYFDKDHDDDIDMEESDE